MSRAVRVTVGEDGRPIGRDAGLVSTLAEYQEAVMRSTHLDPVLTECIRLRCARQHDCRICQTLRLSDAALAGADDDMTAKIDHYEDSDLAERTKVALRIVDAFIWRPSDIDESLVLQAHEHFTDTEISEILIDITKWSTQKIHVTLGTDAADRLPVNESGIAYFTFADDGRVDALTAQIATADGR